MQTTIKSTTATTLRLSFAFALVLALIAGVGWYGLQGLTEDEQSEARSRLLLQKYHLATQLQNELMAQSLTSLSNAHSLHFSNYDPASENRTEPENTNIIIKQLLQLELDEFERDTLKRQDEMAKRQLALHSRAGELIGSGNKMAADRIYHADLIPLHEIQLSTLRALLAHYNGLLTSEHQQKEVLHDTLIHTTKSAGISSLLLGIIVAIIGIAYINSIHRRLVGNSEELKEILDGMITGVIVIDESGIIENFNHAAAEMFGYKKNEILGHHLNQLLGAHAQSRHNDYLHHYFKRGETVIHLGERTVTAVRADGTKFPMRIMLSQLPVHKDGKQRVIASCSDVTTLKEQEARLRISQKMDALGKLTGGIAHDYNNILTIIIGYTDMLAENAPQESGLQRYIQEIKQATESGKKLTTKLLNFARSKPLEIEVIDINQAILDTRMMIEHALSGNSKLQLHLAPTICRVSVNVDDLQHALLNLTINAHHAMPGGGTLTLSTHHITLDPHTAQQKKYPPGDYVVLTVEDTGCGMDERTRSQIFEPFFSTKGDGGTGLGLSQVYGFVKRSMGFIEVVSSPGLGTSFELFFPRASAPATQPTPAS